MTKEESDEWEAMKIQALWEAYLERKRKPSPYR